MLEKLLNAILALTAAFEAANGAKPSGKKNADTDTDGDGGETETKPLTPAQKKAAAAAKAKEDAEDKPARGKKVTREDLTKLMNDVKEELGAPVAKKLIKDIGGVERLAEVDDDDIKELFDAATKKLGAASEKDGGDDNL